MTSLRELDDRRDESLRSLRLQTAVMFARWPLDFPPLSSPQPSDPPIFPRLAPFLLWPFRLRTVDQ